MKTIYSTYGAFAALKEDGTVQVSGDYRCGGDCYFALSGISNLFGTTIYRGVSIYPQIYQLENGLYPFPTSQPTSQPASQPNTLQSLTGAEIAGILVGVLVATGAICGVLYYLFWWMPRLKEKNASSVGATSTAYGDLKVQNPIQESNRATTANGALDDL